MTDALAKGPNPLTARRVQKPTGPNPATARLVTKQNTSFLDAASNIAGALQHDIVAGLQGTSPDTSMYKKLGEVAEMDWGQAVKDESGQYVPLDSSKHVVFMDPKTKQPAVFLRNKETEERWGAMGRIVGAGAITGPLTKAVKGTVAASKGATVADDFAAHGIEPGISHLTNNRTVKTAHNALREVPLASNIIDKSEKGMLQATSSAVERTAGKYGAGQTMEDAGSALRRGAEKFVKGTNATPEEDLLKVPTRKGGFDRKSRALYGRVDKFFGEGDTIEAKSTFQALTEPNSKFDNKVLGEAFVDPKLKPFSDALQKSTNGQMSFNDLKAFRTEVGRLLKKPSILSDINQDQLRQVYGALSDDMRAAAAAKGPEAVKAFERANTYFKAGLDRIKTTLDGVLKEVNSVEKVAGDLKTIAANGKTSANIAKLRRLRKSVPDEEWKVVSSSLLKEMGKPVASAAGTGADFSPATFLTNWSKLSKKAKYELFTTAGNHELRRELDSLVRVIGEQKNVGKLANHSGTARQILYGATGAGMMADPVTTILTGVTAAGAALALTSPKVVKVLHQIAVYEKKFPGKALTTQYARLRHAALGVPRFHMELQGLLKPLRAQTQPTKEGTATAEGRTQQ